MAQKRWARWFDWLAVERSRRSNYNSHEGWEFMRTLERCGVFVLAFASVCAAQFVPCKTSSDSTVGHYRQVTIQRVRFFEPTGEVEASVLVPDSDAPVPGIVFSHSEILGTNEAADLRQFAFALARAGAASIILDGTIDWRIPNDASGRPPHLMACAGQWLLLHVKLDRHRLAHAGPTRHWGGGDTPFCVPGEVPCWPSGPWLNFGQTSPAEFRNTEGMLTHEGRVSMARFAQDTLHLKEVNPEWLRSAPDGLFSR